MLSRRSLLSLFGVASAVHLTRCVGPVTVGGADATADAASSDAALEASATAEAGAEAAAADGAVLRWATGGTRVIGTGYPDPFASPGTTCALSCQATIGPCHTTSAMKSDLSDGVDGLPVLLSLRFLDDACAPLQNAIVELWHTNSSGIYSGNLNNNMCNTAAEDRAASYFRGYLRTDASGRVDFKTCFPGWYSSRAIHIHVRVLVGDYQAADNATAAVITQLFFSDDLVRSIFANEPLYAPHGTPDTLLGTDNVIGGTADKTPYIADVTRLPDGVMQASKTFLVRAAGTNCTLQGSGMMGGPGGDGGRPPPPGSDASSG